jgi:hypothetical protein
MRIETVNAIYEDTEDKLKTIDGRIYRCSCGEEHIHHVSDIMQVHGTDGYTYSYVCCCGNKINILVKDVHCKG